MVRLLLFCEVILFVSGIGLSLYRGHGLTRTKQLFVLVAVFALSVVATWGYRSYRNTRLLERSSYSHAITDYDQFVFAVAADLSRYRVLSQLPASEVLSDVLHTAQRVYRSKCVASDKEGWLFQPGAWTDHPEYAYAGHTAKVVGMQPLPVANIAEDSSHSHRFPLWLFSMMRAYPAASAEYQFYDRLRIGLGNQFVRKVLIRPSPEFPAYRLTNFMDGSNGVYRWGYPTLGVDHGYGPYELSGTLLEGWWTFLDSAEVRNVYQETARSFPLSSKVLDTYVGPNTSRERNVLQAAPESYRNGYMELISRLARHKLVSAQETPPSYAPDQTDKDLWAKTVKPHLQGSLWSTRDAADGCEFLMVPLHGAFAGNEKEWQDQFFEHFNRFNSRRSELTDQSIDRIQYLFFTSRFIVVAQESGQGDRIPKGLPEFIQGEVEDLWLRVPAPHWFRSPFHGLREKVTWILATGS